MTRVRRQTIHLLQLLSVNTYLCRQGDVSEEAVDLCGRSSEAEWPWSKYRGRRNCPPPWKKRRSCRWRPWATLETEEKRVYSEPKTLNEVDNTSLMLIKKNTNKKIINNKITKKMTSSEFWHNQGGKCGEKLKNFFTADIFTCQTQLELITLIAAGAEALLLLLVSPVLCLAITSQYVNSVLWTIQSIQVF